MRYIYLFLTCVACPLLRAQDYIGAGQTAGVSVSASSQYANPDLWVDTALAIHTIDGSGMLAPDYDAGRFLMQASLGFEESHITDVRNMGYEAWIDYQMGLPIEFILPEVEHVLQIEIDSALAHGAMPEDLPGRPSYVHFNYAWWQVNMTNDDLLRHKVAAALSEILVISRLSDLSEYGDGLASFYDKLLTHAFGNYRDLLTDVTLHPCMGFYLTHLNNPKTDTAQKIRPDENYAREVMQLFTIGLYELNLNGNRKKINNEEIPTYGQDDIRELAKVFTGLGVGGVIPNMYNSEPVFGMGIYIADMTVPMKMWDEDDPSTSWRDEDQHEDGNKYFLGDTVLANVSGLHEIHQALDILFNHPNVGPFIAYRLIQRLVKSNPSPSYIRRVAEVFNNNGSGVRGDMAAVIKAILLDNEARTCPNQQGAAHSRLKEPLFRYIHFARMVDKYHPDGFYWNVNWSFYSEVQQDILASPSVFNFFLPDDTPNGPISANDLVAPEFKLHDSRTAIGYMNRMHAMCYWDGVMSNWSEYNENRTVWDYEPLMPMTRDPEVYINYLDRLFTHGSLSDSHREYIREGLFYFDPYIEWHDTELWRTRLGMYYILISPEYSIMK